MPLVMTVNSSDSVSSARKGLMVRGASVWPMKMLAATLSDSAPLTPITFCIATAMALHHPLHDSEVVENREEGGDEDDDGQNLKREHHAELRGGIGAQRVSEHEPAARRGVAQHGGHARADHLENPAETGLQHQHREGELQAETPGQDAQLDGALVRGHQPGERHDDGEAQHPGETPHQPTTSRMSSRSSGF